MRPLVYIACPYKIDKKLGVATSIELVHSILTMNMVPVAPLLFHFADLIHPRPEDEWYRADLDLLARCDVLYRVAGISEGVEREVAFAELRGIPVVESLSALEEVRTPQSSLLELLLRFVASEKGASYECVRAIFTQCGDLISTAEYVEIGRLLERDPVKLSMELSKERDV